MIQNTDHQISSSGEWGNQLALEQRKGRVMDTHSFAFVFDAIDDSSRRMNAIVSLLEPLLDNQFLYTCAGLLDAGAGDLEQKSTAEAWMKQNYDGVSSAVFAAVLLAQDTMNALEAATMRLYAAKQGGPLE